MRLLLILLVGMNFSPAHANAVSPGLSEFLDVEMKRAGVPGLTYALLNGETVRSGAHGDIPIVDGGSGDVDTPFALGSISKSFTALAVMKRVEAGEVDLDAAIADYLPEFADSPARSVTVRQLLSHTSGYFTRQGNGFARDSGADRMALSRQAARIARWKPIGPPGETWVYSNANYIILGALLEAVSGQPYDALIQTEILGPLGMSRSFVSDGARHSNIAAGHRPWFIVKPADRSGATDRVNAPAGGVFASARDLARYVGMMMNGKDDIVTARTKTMMMSPASEASPYYGLGWSLDPEAGAVFHSGLTPGVETLAVFIPAERRAALILINANGGFGFGETTRLMTGFTAQALGLEAPVVTGGWGRKALVLIFVISPALFILGILQSFHARASLKEMSGWREHLRLWLPVLATLALTVTSLMVMPALFGTPLSTFWLFQPGFTLALIATALTGVLWSSSRLLFAFSRARHRL